MMLFHVSHHNTIPLILCMKYQHFVIFAWNNSKITINYFNIRYALCVFTVHSTSNCRESVEYTVDYVGYLRSM